MATRVLFLEDDAADFELITEILRRDGFDLEATQAPNRTEFETAFSAGDFDFVLSDYSIPGYSGFAALRYVREQNREIPFILISGALSEEQAVEGLKAGATDYIIKQRLHRLAPAIRRALEQAAERREHAESQKRLEEVEAQLLRAQRIHTVGWLSGGIAHDLNNGLAPIIMAAEILGDDIQTESGRRMIDLVRISAKRCADMVKQILSFSRGAGISREPLNPARVTDEIAALARETFPRLITIETHHESGVRLFEGNLTQMHQVIMNLLVNARDAISGAGRISITTRNTRLKNKRNPATGAAVSGPFVSIRVKDTGTGIAPDIREKIFEPFFTTKEAGKGTGLGLSTVYTIVKNHGGFIELESELGEGTTFELFFPAHVEKPEQVDDAAATKLATARGERLLVVDDEEGLLAILKSTLDALGYEVATATGGLEAMAILGTGDRKFDVVITDWIMPILSGRELVQKIRLQSPTVKIVVVTGSGGLDEETIRDCQIDAVLPKPYTTESLLEAIRGTVGKAGSASVRRESETA